MKRILILAALAALPASAQFFAVGGATEITQLLNYGQLSASYAKQLQQLTTAIQTYDQIMIAGRLLTSQQWRNASQDLANIAGIVQVERSLAYSMAGVDKAFAARYPGYVPPAQAPYYTQYDAWAKTAQATTQGAIAGSNLSYNQMLSQQSYVAYLQAQNTSAAGQMQAIQIGNQVGVENIKVLNDLRSLQMANTQSMQTYYGYTIQKDQHQAGYERDFYAPNKPGRDGVGW